MATVSSRRHVRKSLTPNHWQWYYADVLARMPFWDSLAEMMSDTPQEKTANLLAVVAAFRQITRHRTRPQLLGIAVTAIRRQKKTG